jgi:hypothetical protein
VVALDDAEREELERLRAEVSELRAQAGRGTAAADPTRPGAAGAPTGSSGGRAGRRARWTVAMVLIVVAALLAPATLIARYARNQILDTDEYVATVAPLASDPALQSAVANIVTTRLMDRIDVEQVTRDALDQLAERGAPDAVVALAVPITDQVEGFVRREVRSFLGTQTFADLWVAANRVAHEQVDAALTGGGDAISTEDGVVRVDLGEVVERVQQRLVDRGFSLAENIPEVDASVTLVQSEKLSRVQTAVDWLDRTASAMPLILLLLVALAVAVAPNRRKALLWAVVGMMLGVLIVGLSVAAARSWYVDSGNTRLPPDASSSLIRTLLAPLREAFRATLLVGLAVILVLLLTGPSATARRIRALAVRGGEAVARITSSGVHTPSGLEAWVGANKALLQIAGAVVGVLVLALWSYPGPGVVLGVLLLVGGWVALVEYVGRAAAREEPEADTGTGAGPGVVTGSPGA